MPYLDRFLNNSFYIINPVVIMKTCGKSEKVVTKAFTKGEYFTENGKKEAK